MKYKIFILDFTLHLHTCKSVAITLNFFLVLSFVLTRRVTCGVNPSFLPILRHHGINANLHNRYLNSC